MQFYVSGSRAVPRLRSGPPGAAAGVAAAAFDRAHKKRLRAAASVPFGKVFGQMA